MGPGAIRITAADFVIPPEFCGLTLAERSSGQTGGVRLELQAERGRTLLGPCYQQVPLRLLPPFHFASEPAALLYLLNPTAGLMDGDGHWFEFTVQSGVCAVVTGQSATRIHPCLRGFSTQQWHIRVADGAQLVVLPGPAIPFQNCRYYQRVRIDLAPHAKLIWGDIWLPGRYARAGLSELFQFDCLIQDLQVRRQSSLVYRERFCWKGPWEPEISHWHLGPTLACANLFISSDPELLTPWSAPSDRKQAFDIKNQAAKQTGLRQAELRLACGDTCIRWCGTPAAVTRELVACALQRAASWNKSNAEPWLLNSSHLGPNHWFSRTPECLDVLSSPRHAQTAAEQNDVS